MKSNKRFHRDGKHVYSAAPGMSHATFTRVLRLIMLTVLAVSMVLAVSLAAPKAQANGVTDPLNSGNAMQTAGVDSSGTLHWQLVGQLKAQWNPSVMSRDGNYLHTSSVYWTTTNSSYDISYASSEGVYKPVLGEMRDFNFHKNIPSYTTRKVLSIKWQRQPGDNVIWNYTGNAGSDASTMFYRSAVGVYKGVRESGETYKSNLSVYFWDYHGYPHSYDIISKKYQQQDGSTVHSPDPSYTPIFRVNDGSDQVWCAWRPVVYRRDGRGVAQQAESAAGAVDPRTGYIYFQTGLDNVAHLDYWWIKNSSCSLAHSGSCESWANDAGVQFQIWDPATGRWIYSAQIQPASANERSRFYLSSSAWKKGERRTYLDPTSTLFQKMSATERNTYDTNLNDFVGWDYYRPGQGFTIDQNGNIHLLVTTSNRVKIDGKGQLTTSGSNPMAETTEYTETEVEIDPLRDSKGYFLQPRIKYPGTSISLSDPAIKAWTYRVANKFSSQTQKTSSGDTISYRAGMGQYQSVGYINGHFLALGEYGLWGVTPSTAFPNTNAVGDAGEHRYTPFYPSIMLASGQSDGAIRLIYSGEAGSSDLMMCGDKHGGGFADKFAFGSLTTGQIVRSIGGTVYWNTTGSGRLDNPGGKDNPRLEGETIALYQAAKPSDTSARLIGVTQTDSLGEYEFYPEGSENSDSASYYVRLVQPQVNIGTLGAAKQATTHSLTGDQTVYVSTILTKSGDPSSRLVERYSRVGSVYHRTVGLRNAVQTWARTDGVITGLNADDMSIVAKNNGANVEGLSIAATAACIAGSNLVRQDSTNTYSQCYGARKAPYVDSSLPSDMTATSTVTIADMPIYNVVSVTGDNQMMRLDVTADFAVTAVGSYGDSPAPPFMSHTFPGNTTGKYNSDGSFLTGADPKALHLGASNGTYEDGAYKNDTNFAGTDYNMTGREHDSDDGVSLSAHGSFDSKGTDGKVIVSNNAIKVTVSGYAGDKYRVVGWLSDACMSGSDRHSCQTPLNWSVMASESPVFRSKELTLPDQHNSDGTSTVELVTTNTTQFDKTWKLEDKLVTQGGTSGHVNELTALFKYILRVEVVPADNGSGTDNGIGALSNLKPSNRATTPTGSTDPDESTRQYEGPNYGTTAANSHSWTNPGEIEDYRMTIINNTAPVVRLQTAIIDGDMLPDDPTFTYQNVNSAYPSNRRVRTKSITLTKLNEFQPTLQEMASADSHVSDVLNQSVWYPLNLDKDGLPIPEKWTIPVFNMPWGYKSKESRDNQTQSSISTTKQPDGVWYDSKASYKVEGTTKTGLTCFRTYADNDQSTLDLASLGSSISVANEPASDADIATAVKKSVLVGADTEGRLKLTFSPETVPKAAVVTCLVPYSQKRFELPLTGKAFPWAGVVGLILLLIGLAGTAIVLVRRR